MAIAPLFPLTKQFQSRDGKNNVDGFLRVFLSGTDDRAVTYKDYSGTLNTADIHLDNDGRAVVLCDDSRAYRLEVYARDGGLLWTQQPTYCVARGGGESIADIRSTDGTIIVEKTSSGGSEIYDLSVNPEDDPRFLEWIRCTWYDLVDGVYVPRYADGTMEVGSRGVNLSAGMLYHVTATVRVNKPEAMNPFYGEVGIHLGLYDGTETTAIRDFTRIADGSMGLSQDFTVEADVPVGDTEAQLVVTIDGGTDNVTFNLMSVDVHRVYSGVAFVPGGLATREWVGEHYQETLVAGQNITIDPTTNTISADAAPQVQSDWTENDSSKPSYIKHKPVLAEVATSGDYDDLSNKPTIPVVKTLVAGQNVTLDETPTTITINAEGGGGVRDQSDWDETDPQDPSYIRNKPNIPDVPPMKSLVAGTNVSITEDANGVTISASGAPQQQADWDQNDSSAVDYIKNKPTIPAAQVNSDWNANSGVAQILNKPNLATVATSGNYEDLSNKPTIPTFTTEQMAAMNSGINSTKVSGYDTHVADTTIHVTSTDKTNWNAKEDASNKKQTLDPSSTTDFPSSAATANFVNSSVATNTATFLGNFTLAELGLTYPATDSQIASALNSHTWPVGVTPTNNDYVYVEIADPQTTSIDDRVERFKYNGSAWAYEYTLNNSSFTAAEKAAIDSGIDSTKVSTYDAHVANTNIHVTASDKSTWNGKQDAISDLSTIRSGASAGATAVQPGDLAAVALSGNYSDLNGTPTIPTVDQTYDGTSANAQSGVAVASALSGKEDEFDAGAGLEFTTDGQGNRVLQVEGPVDLVAGPGIVIDNPDGNTIRVSQATPCDETVIWTVPSGSEDSNNYSITLSETIHNFEEIAVYCKCTRLAGVQVMIKNEYPVCDAGNTMFADGISTNHWNVTAGQNAHYTVGVDVRLTGSTGYIGENYRYGMPNGSNTLDATRESNNSIYPHPYKIVGIKRVANN